jgi:hypothetical protein
MNPSERDLDDFSLPGTGDEAVACRAAIAVAALADVNSGFEGNGRFTPAVPPRSAISDSDER